MRKKAKRSANLAGLDRLRGCQYVDVRLEKEAWLLSDIKSPLGRHFKSSSFMLWTNSFSPHFLSALRRTNLLLTSPCKELLVSPLPLPFGGVPTGLYGHMLSNVVPNTSAPGVVAYRVA